MASVKKCRHCQSEIEVEVAGVGPLLFVGPGLIKATVCPQWYLEGNDVIAETFNRLILWPGFRWRECYTNGKS